MTLLAEDCSATIPSYTIAALLCAQHLPPRLARAFLEPRLIQVLAERRMRGMVLIHIDAPEGRLRVPQLMMMSNDI